MVGFRFRGVRGVRGNVVKNRIPIPRHAGMIPFHFDPKGRIGGPLLRALPGASVCPARMTSLLLSLKDRLRSESLWSHHLLSYDWVPPETNLGRLCPRMKIPRGWAPLRQPGLPRWRNRHVSGSSCVPDAIPRSPWPLRRERKLRLGGGPPRWSPSPKLPFPPWIWKLFFGLSSSEWCSASEAKFFWEVGFRR